MPESGPEHRLNPMPSLISLIKKSFMEYFGRYAGIVMYQNSNSAFILYQNEASVIVVSVRILYILE